MTEIYDYIRLLYARVGKPYCPYHGIEIESQTVQQMVDRILELEEHYKIQLLAPVISHRKGSHEKLIEDIGKKGYVRLRVDDEIVDVNESASIDKIKITQLKLLLIDL